MPPMWYSSGLQFQCKQCGRCCSGEPGYVWVTEEEITAIAAELGSPRDRFEATFVREIKGRGKSLVEFEDGDCCLLGAESRKCQVYESRPTQCRTWPFWQRNVDSKNSWKKTAKFCPGCNQGPIFSADYVENSAKKTS